MTKAATMTTPPSDPHPPKISEGGGSLTPGVPSGSLSPGAGAQEIADPIRPIDLGKRASALWSELVKPGMAVERRVLAAEVCRMTDRLDDYALALAEDPTADCKSEARLTAQAIQRMLVALAGESGAATPVPTAPTQTGGTLADEIAARRAARQADATG